jgi:fimbrial chaperone protein
MPVGIKRRRSSPLRRWLKTGVWIIAGAALAAPAWAASFKINPVQIVLPADRQAASLIISNSDAAPVSLRIMGYRWSQADGLDVYSPTTDVIASPPIFTIPGGKSQLVRVGLRPGTAVTAYRVIFAEIPRDRPAEGQVQVQLRLNLPLYVLPRHAIPAELSWRTWTDRSGAMVAEGRNSGSLPAQVLALSTEQGGRRVVLSQQMGVVLPGGARVWKLTARTAFRVGQPLSLTVRSPSGETQARVVLEQR